MNNFQDKRQNRIDRYNELAQKAESKSDDSYKKAKKESSVIPFGQPILVGHHSEKRHRNHLKRIDGAFETSFKEQKKADYYRDKAESAQNNKSIFSDDPDAVQKLKNKIELLEQSQTKMKSINKEFRKHKSDLSKVDLSKVDLDQNMLREIKSNMQSWHKVPFPTYSLSNNNANIRRLKQRLKRLERMASDTPTETEKNGVKIVENVQENRCQIFFPIIPDENIRKFLKSHGFRWARYSGCWQRHRSDNATHFANEILKLVEKEVNEK